MQERSSVTQRIVGFLKAPSGIRCFFDLRIGNTNKDRDICDGPIFQVPIKNADNMKYNKALGVAICKSESFAICLSVSLVGKGGSAVIHRYRHGVVVFEFCVNTIEIQWVPESASYPVLRILVFRVIRLVQNSHDFGEAIRTAAVLHGSVAFCLCAVGMNVVEKINKALHLDVVRPTVPKIILVLQVFIGGEHFF